MIKSLLIACLAAVLVCGPVSAQEHARKKAHTTETRKSKTETAASCKAPAVGSCASCSITCRPAETATCSPGQVSADMCTTQPFCKCAMRY